MPNRLEGPTAADDVERSTEAILGKLLRGGSGGGSAGVSLATKANPWAEWDVSLSASDVRLQVCGHAPVRRCLGGVAGPLIQPARPPSPPVPTLCSPALPAHPLCRCLFSHAYLVPVPPLPPARRAARVTSCLPRGHRSWRPRWRRSAASRLNSSTCTRRTGVAQPLISDRVVHVLLHLAIPIAEAARLEPSGPRDTALLCAPSDRRPLLAS